MSRLAMSITRTAAGLILLVLLAACGGTGPEDISRDDLLRFFYAQEFSTTTGGTSVDQLANGAVVDITLHANGTTSGRLFVPGGAEGGADLEASLAGTFSFDDATNRVEFDQAADTFMRDLDFTAQRGEEGLQLVGERVFGETTVRLILVQGGVI